MYHYCYERNGLKTYYFFSPSTLNALSVNSSRQKDSLFHTFFEPRRTRCPDIITAHMDVLFLSIICSSLLNFPIKAKEYWRETLSKWDQSDAREVHGLSKQNPKAE